MHVQYVNSELIIFRDATYQEVVLALRLMQRLIAVNWDSERDYDGRPLPPNKLSTLAAELRQGLSPARGEATGRLLSVLSSASLWDVTFTGNQTARATWDHAKLHAMAPSARMYERYKLNKMVNGKVTGLSRRILGFNRSFARRLSTPPAPPSRRPTRVGTVRVAMASTGVPARVARAATPALTYAPEAPVLPAASAPAVITGTRERAPAGAAHAAPLVHRVDAVGGVSAGAVSWPREAPATGATGTAAATVASRVTTAAAAVSHALATTAAAAYLLLVTRPVPVVAHHVVPAIDSLYVRVYQDIGYELYDRMWLRQNTSAAATARAIAFAEAVWPRAETGVIANSRLMSAFVNEVATIKALTDADRGTWERVDGVLVDVPDEVVDAMAREAVAFAWESKYDTHGPGAVPKTSYRERFERRASPAFIQRYTGFVYGRRVREKYARLAQETVIACDIFKTRLNAAYGASI